MPAIVLTGQNTRLNLRSLYCMSVKTERVKQPTAPTQTRMEKMEVSSSTSGSKILELTVRSLPKSQWKLWLLYVHPPALAAGVQ